MCETMLESFKIYQSRKNTYYIKSLLYYILREKILRRTVCDVISLQVYRAWMCLSLQIQ